MSEEFDVIVVGSGITGGWAAKEFSEKGFKTLVLERGRHVEHQGDQYNDMQLPWEMANRALMPEKYDQDGNYRDVHEMGYIYRNDIKHFFVDEIEHPYTTPEDRPAMWIRGYQLGGRSLTWGRQSYRWSQKDFQANAKDGHGIPWPIGYEDIAPWYDYVEKFTGISGNKDNLDILPDGEFLKPWDMSCAEKFVSENLKINRPDRPMIIGRCAHLTDPQEVHTDLGRGQCQARNHCMRGCSFGAYFCSLSSTLPAARNAGNVTIVTDAIVASVDHDDETGKASGVTVVDYHTKEQRKYKARVVFLCAGSLASLQIMLNSKSSTHPNGIANSSGMLGHYITDHFGRSGANGVVPGFEDRYSFGRRPNGMYVPNFRHEKTDDVDFVRGYGYQGHAAYRPRKGTTAHTAGIGAHAKAQVGQAEPWRIGFGMFGEMLPYFDNQVTLNPNKTDKWGIPVLHIDAHGRENERKMMVQAANDAEEFLIAGGCVDVVKTLPEINDPIQIGRLIHEMGGACMGSDPKGSVLNKWNQAHDVPNLFVTDGACMSSCATQNPSLTYMALTARAADHAAKLMKAGQL